jgi:hypothetical protein
MASGDTRFPKRKRCAEPGKSKSGDIGVSEGRQASNPSPAISLASGGCSTFEIALWWKT